MRMFSQRIAVRDARAQRRGRAHALHRPPRARHAGACSSRWTGPRPRRRPTTASRSTSPSTTAAARRSSMRPTRYSGGGEEAFRQLLYAPEMHDPDLIIRTSGEQRTSNYLLWQSAYSELVFADELWPDFSREAFRGRAGRVRAPRSAGSGGADGGPIAPTSRAARPRASGAPGARAGATRARTSARAWPPRSRPSPSRWLIVGFGNWVFVAGPRRARVRLPARAVRDVRLHQPVAPGRLHGAIALLVAAHLGGQASVLGAFVACVPWVFLLCLLQPRHAGAPGVAVTMLGLTLDRPGLRARRAAARPAPRRRDRHRRAGGDVHRRHRRLPRRARVGHAAPGAVDLAQQDARGAGHRLRSSASRRCGWPGSTRTG